MSRIQAKLHPHLSDYVDGLFDGTAIEYEHCLSRSTTVYVGNMSFYTTEMQAHALFNRAGPVKKILMGLDRFNNTPCGFCFIEYFSREDAETCVRFLNGSLLDDRPIRTDFDWGGRLETRRFGRGRNGGQVRDEHRTTFDADRGGWGKIVESNLKQQQQEKQHPQQGPPLSSGDNTDRQKRAKVEDDEKMEDS